MRVPRLSQAPRIDGFIDEVEWRNAARWTGLLLQTAGHALIPPEMQPQVCFGYDDQFIYVALRWPNPSRRYPVARAARDDMVEILEDDHFQLLLVPDHPTRASRVGEGYYRISVNALGAVEDRWISAGRPDRELLWSYGGQVRHRMLPAAWEMEMSIAWSALQTDPAEGRVIHAQWGFVSAATPVRTGLWWAPASAERPEDSLGVLDFRPGPAAQLIAIGAIGLGELELRARVVGAPSARFSVQLTDSGGRDLLRESAEGPEWRLRKRELGLSDQQNTWHLEVHAGDSLLLRQRARVDRWTDAWRNRHVQPWVNARTTEPPKPATFPEDQPETFLALLSAQRRRLQPLEAAYGAAKSAGDLESAAAIAQRLIREAPYHPIGYLLAAVHAAAENRTEDALRLLEQAADRGFNNADAVRSTPELQSLRGNPRFDAILSRISSNSGLQLSLRAEPAEVRDGVVTIDERNIAWNPQLNLPVAVYRFSAEGPGNLLVAQKGSELADWLNTRYRDGQACGLWGVLYDNRDDGHARLPRDLFPQLAHIRYAGLARDLQLHRGLAASILHDGIVIGNASLAVTSGPYWRSLPRAAHSDPRIMTLIYIQYRANQLYVHPAHRDYPREPPSPQSSNAKPLEDLFFANAPYPWVSRGSSGSDRPHLEVLAYTLAAFRPEVKEALKSRGLLMATAQMLIRYHQRGIGTADAYLSGRAHPPVFPGESLQPLQSARAAAEITLNTLPPWAEIRVVEEDRPRLGVDFFEAPGRGEELFTTPAAIARIYRSVSHERRYLLSAEGSFDPNGRPLTFSWRLLQGDPTRVEIRPFGERHERAEIRIRWHPAPFALTDNPSLTTCRVDIAVFAHNGTYFSAPAFFTIYFPPAERRTYAADGRILRVEYRTSGVPYTDPAVYTPREWVDEYEYDGHGRLVGWARHRAGDTVRYDGQGRVITEDGTPREAVYRVVADGPLPRLEPVP